MKFVVLSFLMKLCKKTGFYKLVNYIRKMRNKEKIQAFLYDWTEALDYIEKGDKFDVKAISMFLPRGYIAMDKNKRWVWHKRKPKIQDGWYWSSDGLWWNLGVFNLKPAVDWRKSVKKVGRGSKFQLSI